MYNEIKSIKEPNEEDCYLGLIRAYQREIDELKQENINKKQQILENKISLKDVEYQEKIKLQQRIDKAIEYIEVLDKNEFETIDDVIVLDNYLSDLLDILRGDDNE